MKGKPKIAQLSLMKISSNLNQNKEGKSQNLQLEKALLSFYFTYFITTFARYLCFGFMENLTFDFIIGKTEFKRSDIVVSFSKQFLQKMLTIFCKYITTENSSQVFFFPNSWFIQLNSIALINVRWFFWHKLYCFRWFLSHIFYYCLSQTQARAYLSTLFL